MRKAFKDIIRVILIGTSISSLSLNVYAEFCTDLENEIKTVHDKQNEFKIDDSDSPTLEKLKSTRDAHMAQVIALRSLKNIRDEYQKFKKETEDLDVAKLFSGDTKKALLELERHTQAVTKFAVIHSTVSALAKKQGQSAAENANEENPFVKVFNHLKDGDGKDLYSYVKSACDNASDDVKKECSVFNDFTENFKLDEGYEEMAKNTINNYGQLLKKIYAGSATKEDASSFLDEHLTALKDDQYKISLDKTDGGRPSLAINTPNNSLSLLSESTQLKRYYRDTMGILRQEVGLHNENKDIFKTSIGAHASVYLQDIISDDSFRDISLSLNRLKECHSKLVECKEMIDTEKLANAINKAMENNPERINVDHIDFSLQQFEKRDSERQKTKNAIHDLLKKGMNDANTYSKTTSSNIDFNGEVAATLHQLCPNNISSSDIIISPGNDPKKEVPEKLLSCLEEEMDADSVDELIKDQELKLAEVEKAISNIFTAKPMKDLEVIKAILMKKYKVNCNEDNINEYRCMPSIQGESSKLKSLSIISDALEEELIVEDYSRYYYGAKDTNDYQTSNRYIEEFCPQTKLTRCNGRKVDDPNEGEYQDQFPKACEYLKVRSCYQQEVSLAKDRLKLDDNEYMDWDPISETSVIRRHRQSYWPQVAMYAAENSYRFMGPMIATQNLRAQLPSTIYTGMFQQQQLAYQEQYYDWYMGQLDLSDANMFGFWGGPFYSNTGSYNFNYGYSW